MSEGKRIQQETKDKQKTKIPSVKDSKYWKPDMIFKWIEYAKDLEHLIKNIRVVAVIVNRDSHGRFWMDSEEIEKLAPNFPF